MAPARLPPPQPLLGYAEEFRKNQAKEGREAKSSLSSLSSLIGFDPTHIEPVRASFLLSDAILLTEYPSTNLARNIIGLSASVLLLVASVVPTSGVLIQADVLA